MTDGPPGDRWPIRIYYEDTDSGGVVYHTAYLRFMERARTEWLRARGIGLGACRQQFSVVFVVHSVQIQFHHAARLDDALTVGTDLSHARGARLSFRQYIVRDADHKVCTEALVTVACVDAVQLRPRRVPMALRHILAV